MAKPSEKSSIMNDFISRLFGKDRLTTISQNKCMSCGNKVGAFKSALCEREYKISGLCQSCQDTVI